MLLTTACGTRRRRGLIKFTDALLSQEYLGMPNLVVVSVVKAGYNEPGPEWRAPRDEEMLADHELGGWVREKKASPIRRRQIA